MRRYLFIVGILLIAVGFSAQRYFQGNNQSQVGSIAPSSPTPPAPILPQRTSLFVPYWSLGYALPITYERLIYFGITPNSSAIEKNDLGYQRISSFTSGVPSGVETLLTLRMLNNDINFDILENKKSQQRIIAETISITRENGFDGIVLDLELKALPFESLMSQITAFVGEFNKQADQEGLSLTVMQYGDTFYRVRPFNVAEIAKNSDEIMIMAYDFHKSGGSTPGPNFPLGGNTQYGYDYSQMTDGFMKSVPAQKLTVVFGYFGYDWPTNDKGVAINAGAPFSYNEIAQQYLQDCETCVIERDQLSSETKVTYMSGDNIPHIVWFEDEISIQKKREYLKSKGITSYSYWAHSYF